ncbi:hypothetical protein EVAR_95485_1 [Eumeta japonica]|uniref:Uncharacterized protein n=1 Tax=Eumeta variegata TaxID=151549 RepID=A0A4C1UK93_EUMVA|nr:hypothetical protein EVAR_95485_1 [Eumeta japonica]
MRVRRVRRVLSSDTTTDRSQRQQTDLMIHTERLYDPMRKHHSRHARIEKERRGARGARGREREREREREETHTNTVHLRMHGKKIGVDS